MLLCKSSHILQLAKTCFPSLIHFCWTVSLLWSKDLEIFNTDADHEACFAFEQDGISNNLGKRIFRHFLGGLVCNRTSEIMWKLILWYCARSLKNHERNIADEITPQIPPRYRPEMTGKAASLNRYVHVMKEGRSGICLSDCHRWVRRTNESTVGNGIAVIVITLDRY